MSDLPYDNTRDACQRCFEKRHIEGEKYCPGCRRKVLKQMERDGYLEQVPRDRPKRPPVQTNGFGELSLEELPDGGRVVGRW